MKKVILLLSVVSIALLQPTAPALAQGYSVIKSFGVLTNATGFSPRSPLVRGSDGTLYGLASSGEGSARGSVFKIQPDGTGFTVLKLFTNQLDGAYPIALLLNGATLYGTTSGGGSSNIPAGTVFKMNTNGSGYTILKSFGYYEAAYPVGALAFSGSNLFGTTYYGGNGSYSYGGGALFKLDTNGASFSILKDFTNATEGRYLSGVATADGNVLYGTSEAGGALGYGSAFKLNGDGSGFTILREFSGSDGVRPVARPLLIGGLLYGATYGGGISNNGVIYRMDTNGGGHTVLKSFTGATGLAPSSSLLLDGNSLYGTTMFGGSSNAGVVFKITTNGTGYTVVRSLSQNDGSYPQSGLIIDGTTLYGSAGNGGNSGVGTLFKLTTSGSGFTVLKHFGYSDAVQPAAGVIRVGDSLYGTTLVGSPGGQGSVFKIGTNGTGYSLLVNFARTNGYWPNGELTAVGNRLYGAARYGGSGGYGVIFAVNSDGTGFKVLKNYTFANGGTPNANLVVSGGMIYGTTTYGGTATNGTVFRMTTNGNNYAVLKNFSAFSASPPYGNSDGAYPRGGLALSGTTLYGFATYGGSERRGTVFKLSTNGSGFTVLKNFTFNDAWSPAGTPLLLGNTLYGMTQWGSNYYSQSTAFKLNTDGTGFSVLRYFGYQEGSYPTAGLTAIGGNLYGTATWGGANYAGTAFRMDTNGANFAVLRSFNSTNGLGHYPQGTLTSDGNVLYGTVQYGGTSGGGAVYALTLAPTFTDQPSSLSVTSSQPAVFSSGATGDEPLRYQWWKGASPLSGETNATYTIPSTITNDAGNYFVVVTNVYGSATSTTAVLSVASGLPFITSQPQGATNLEGAPASFTVTASGSPPLSYQWRKGASFITDATNTTYTIASTVTNDAGNYTVIVANNFGSVTSAVAVLGVISGAPQVLTQPKSATNLVGTAVNFFVTASGTSPLSYQWWKGVTLQTDRTNASYSIPSVTLGDAGNYYAIVTNNYGSATSAVASLTIGCPAVTVNPASLPNTLIAAAYSQPLTAIGGAAPYSFAVTGGALPGGLSLSGAGLLSGTPTNTGTFNFTVTATDSNTCSGARSYAITVSCPAVAVNPALLPGGVVGTPYSATHTASGGTAPYTFTVTSGALPGGLNLTNAVLSGTPTNTGTFNFTVTATDTNGCSGGLSYAVTIGCANIALSPASLPNGFCEAAYNQAFAASGGVEPYTFTVSGGAIPSGWTLATNGVLSGTTTDPGDYSFIITATDVNNCSGTAEYSLTVKDVPHPTNMTWIATVEADWDEPDNWSPQQVPGFLDTAIIPTGANIFVGPDITVSNINLTGSSVRLIGNSITVLGTMNWNAGIVSNSIVVASNAVLNWTSGDLLGAVTVSPSATLAISNTVSMGYNNNYRNGGGVITNNGAVIQAAMIQGFGEAVIRNAGLWLFAGDQNLSENFGTNNFFNFGTLQKTGGVSSATIGWNFNTTGTIASPGGPFIIYQWTGDSVLHGTLTLASGLIDAPLTLASNSFMSWSGADLLGALTVDPGATLLVSNLVSLGFTNNYRNGGGSITNNGTVVLGANVLGYGRAVIHNAALWQIPGNSGLVNSFGTNTFINIGSFQKTGGGSASTIDWWFNTTGSIATPGGPLALYQWIGTNVLNGTLNLGGGTMNAPITVASNAALNWISGDLLGDLNIAPGGSLLISNQVSMGYTNNYRNGGGTITNNGTVTHSANLFGYGRAVIHNAALWQTTGDVAINDSQGTNQFFNTGTFLKTGGTGNATMDWWFNTTGIMGVTNGKLSTTKWTNSSTLNGTLYLGGGSMTAPITAASNATLNWSAGNLENLLTINPGATLVITNNVGLAYNNWNLAQTNFVALTNRGTVRWNGTATGYGRALIYNAGLWQNSGDNSITVWTGSNAFVNAGTLQKTGGTGTSSIDWHFTQANQFDVLSGNFTLNGITTQTNGLTTLNGGQLTANTPFALLGGTLRGGASLVGNLTNSATVSPGLSPGQLTVTSTYNQTSNGVLQIELGGFNAGTNYDKLVVSGAANLNGTVNFSLINSFVPTNGSTFTFLTCGSRTGTFTNVTLPPQLAGTLSNTATSVTLQITNVQAVILAPIVVYGPLVTNGDFVARFLGTPGTTYTVERTAPLVPVNWQKLTNLLAPPTDLGYGVGVFEVRDPWSFTTNRYYRTVYPPY